MNRRQATPRSRIAAALVVALGAIPAFGQEAEQDGFAPTLFEVTIVGATVIVVGEAEPGALIELLAGSRVVGAAEANQRGEWVAAPEGLAGEGAVELRVRTTSPDGRFQYVADRSIRIAASDGLPPEEQADESHRVDPDESPRAEPDDGKPSLDFDPPTLAGLAPETSGSGGADARAEGLIAGPVLVTVRAGDTLWELAETWLGAGAAYPRIVAANPETIANPARLRPGTVLIMPPLAGAP